MRGTFETFIKGESGAVTVDWVVMTAAVVGLGLAVMSVVSQGVADLAGDIQTALQADMIGCSFNPDGTIDTTSC